MTQGGRFYHVMGKGVSKGNAAIWLWQQYQHVTQTTPITLSLGDGPNDISLLRAADYAVVIKNKGQQQITPGDVFTGKVYFTRATGPAGWREGLSHFISGNHKREVCDE
ncbi:MAG: HAD hydrolase family protein [Symbiopectobacterium sp.]|uniref:HAD hydrolase family protein n=1 Tax=Symbiopectobacterium sp. TaxID=2952789 RepID=UPI0039E9263E